MRAIPCPSLRAALETAFCRAIRTGEEQQIGDTASGMFAVIEHSGHSYPGISAPEGWFWVASVTPEGACEHHSGFLSRWDAEITRAKRIAEALTSFN
jgi:hypothetical protein